IRRTGDSGVSCVVLQGEERQLDADAVAVGRLRLDTAHLREYRYAHRHARELKLAGYDREGLDKTVRHNAHAASADVQHHATHFAVAAVSARRRGRERLDLTAVRMTILAPPHCGSGLR